ncbi:MAG TPA: UDP-N-acetylglucosamine 2-epimerase [Flavobacterium sp.]|jgi:UDP-hydrolysing UDP-N-acetyl-D-glucosamine 2-epimerase
MKNPSPKVCVITAARSEYGLLRWLIDEIHQDPDIELQLLVTGSHLLGEYGNTYKEIEADGYPIAQKVDMQLSVSTEANIARSMGRCISGMATAFETLQPDLVVVLGDRYELLSICSAALIMNIPIAHLSGGDITEGAIDDQVRNAVTMMATLHFPGVAESAENITRMINSSRNVYTSGEPGLDNFERLTLLSRNELAKVLNLDVSKKWVLVTQHSETKKPADENLEMAKNIVSALEPHDDIEVIITKANADFGGSQINDYFTQVASGSNKFKLYASLGQLRYLSFMREAFCVIGNSSSGIVEAPYLAKPVINIGERQKGRHLCKNVISASGFGDSIVNAFQTIRSSDFQQNLVPEFHFGNGNSAGFIKNKIKSYLCIE